MEPSLDVAILNSSFISVGYNTDCPSDLWVESFEKVRVEPLDMKNFLRRIIEVEIKGRCWMCLSRFDRSTGYAYYLFEYQEDEALFFLGI